MNTQPKNAFNLEAAAKHGDLRSMKRIKILCSTKTKHVIEMQNVNSMFDHRETRRTAATLGCRSMHLAGKSFTTLDGWGGETIFF